MQKYYWVPETEGPPFVSAQCYSVICAALRAGGARTQKRPARGQETRRWRGRAGANTRGFARAQLHETHLRRRSSLDSRQCSRPRGHGRATRATPRREVASCAGAPRVTIPAFFATSAAFALSSALPTAPRVASAPTTRASSDATTRSTASMLPADAATRRSSSSSNVNAQCREGMERTRRGGGAGPPRMAR